MAKKFNSDLLKIIKVKELHTEDYITYDKFWILSHTNTNYRDSKNLFVKNYNDDVFDYFKE